LHRGLLPFRPAQVSSRRYDHYGKSSANITIFGIQKQENGKKVYKISSFVPFFADFLRSSEAKKDNRQAIFALNTLYGTGICKKGMQGLLPPPHAYS